MLLLDNIICRYGRRAEKSCFISARCLTELLLLEGSVVITLWPCSYMCNIVGVEGYLLCFNVIGSLNPAFGGGYGARVRAMGKNVVFKYHRSILPAGELRMTQHAEINKSFVENAQRFNCWDCIHPIIQPVAL